MANTLEDFFVGLKARLEADVDVIAWANDNFVKTITVKGSVQSGQATEDEYPVFFVDADSGQPEPLVVGGKRQDEVAVLAMDVFWSEAAVATAFTQRLDLIDSVKKALMRDPGLGTNVTDARVRAWARIETTQPIHGVRFEIQGRYRLEV